MQTNKRLSMEYDINLINVVGSAVPDLHWAFDFNENNKTYEVNSVTENVGQILHDTQIVPSNERYGSVAYFDGRHSGIVIDKLTSSCFLNASTCKHGLTFSFWIKHDVKNNSIALSSPSMCKYNNNYTFKVF